MEPMMRKLKTKKLSELIVDFYKTVQYTKKKDPLTIWLSVLGKQIKNETQEVCVKNHILYVKLKNPYLKSDLSSRENEILKKIQISNPEIKKLIFK